MDSSVVKLIFITLILIIVGSKILKVVNWVWLRPKKLEKYLKQQGIKGTSYRFLFGDAKINSQMRNEARSKPMTSFNHDYIPRIYPFLHQTVMKANGKNSFMWMGPMPLVNITEPELVREVLSNMYRFTRPKMFNPLMKLLAPGLISYEGDEWTQHRKIVNPAFYISKLKTISSAFTTSCVEMIDRWETLLKDTSCCEVDVRADLESLTANTISRTTFGTCEEGNRVFELIQEQIVMVARMRESVYIPGSRFLPTKANKRMKETNKEVQKLLKEMVSAKRKSMSLEAGDQEALKDDLLTFLMRSINDDQKLIDDCKSLYLAGRDSTAILLVWTMILLSKHQDWQSAAREEVLKTFGHTNLPDVDGLSQLKIVTMILYEVLRLYPPVTVLSRSVQTETKLGNLSLPAGTMISLPLVVIHHNEEFWGKDAKEFNPERFAQGISKASSTEMPAWFPFSAGPRNCIGQNFTMIEAKMIIAMILQRFAFELSPSYVHAPSVTLILQPQFGAPILLRRL